MLGKEPSGALRSARARYAQIAKDRPPPRPDPLRRPRFRALSAPLVRPLDGLQRRHARAARVGITNTASGFNNCHRHLPELIAAVERSVLAAGGLPITFPTISLGEPFVTPTSLMFRNLMSMDVEEMIRAQPMDAVVLVGGCDKTVPALLMGALAADRPAILLVAGPMMTSRHREKRLGACTDCRRYSAQYRAGRIERAEIEQDRDPARDHRRHLSGEGTASTMACIAETLGMMLPGTAAIPAVHADRLRAAEASGSHAVTMARQGPRPREVVTQASVGNALRVLLAIGGWTNGILHPRRSPAGQAWRCRSRRSIRSATRPRCWSK